MEENPVLILTDITVDDLKILLHYMYYGEVTLPQNQMMDIVKIASKYQIHGLTSHSEEVGFQFPRHSKKTFTFQKW